MTDRVKGFTIALEKDIRDDDFEHIQNAVMMIKGVKSLEPIISDGTEHVTQMRVESKIREGLYNFIRENL